MIDSEYSPDNHNPLKISIKSIIKKLETEIFLSY